MNGDQCFCGDYPGGACDGCGRVKGKPVQNAWIDCTNKRGLLLLADNNDRQIFYDGARAMLDILTAAVVADMTDEQGQTFLSAIRKELA